MNRNWMLLNIALCSTALLLGYELRKQWRAYRIAHDSAKLQPQGAAAFQRPPSAPGSVVPPNYSAIVDKHLFNLERNNLVPPEPEPAAAMKVLAPRPILMGTMGLSGSSYALMVSGSGRGSNIYRRLKVGEDLDGYRLVRVLHDKVVMSADGKELDVRIADQPRPRSQPTAYAGGVGAGGGTRVSALGSPASSASATQPSAGQMPDPDAPEGTVFNGRRKRIVASPFGPTTVWEDAK
ncbi:MAG: hypothetical protein FJW26_01850 [Acidimicrobiia bacterium]|nr:hypothetical protein [Acidimicrobiia bacterium]